MDVQKNIPEVKSLPQEKLCSGLEAVRSYSLSYGGQVLEVFGYIPIYLSRLLTRALSLFTFVLVILSVLNTEGKYNKALSWLLSSIMNNEQPVTCIKSPGGGRAVGELYPSGSSACSLVHDFWARCFSDTMCPPLSQALKRAGRAVA